MSHTDPSWMTRLTTFFLAPTPSSDRREAVALRIAIGGVFVASGLVKLLFDNQGVGRFTRLGLPVPATLATCVSSVEIVAGLLVLLGLFTRAATLALVIDMLVAIAVTKVGLLYGAGPEPVAAAPQTGFWAFAYQARLDVAMLLSNSYLMLAGAGTWSLDAWRARRTASSESRVPIAT